MTTAITKAQNENITTLNAERADIRFSLPTLFKYEKSLFGKKKVLHRTNGSWVDLFENPNVREYKVGDKSASFLVRKRSDWWFRIVLDFEMREIQVKNCYNSDCSRLVNSGSLPCS